MLWGEMFRRGLGGLLKPSCKVFYAYVLEMQEVFQPSHFDLENLERSRNYCANESNKGGYRSASFLWKMFI